MTVQCKQRSETDLSIELFAMINFDKEDEEDDPKVIAQWLEDERNRVLRYLEDQSIFFDRVSVKPSWILYPYLSLWMTESLDTQTVWVICGDCPADYIPTTHLPHPRQVLAAIGKRWEEVADSMLHGKEYLRIRIGNPKNQQELGDLLHRRAGLLKDFSEDDELWES